MSRLRSAYLEPFGVGVVSGMRTLLMPALLGRAFPADPARQAAPAAARLLKVPRVSRALLLGCVGELVVDKLPCTPDRTEAPSLVARAASGGASASVLASMNGETATSVSAVLGAAGAVASALVMVRLRRAAGRRLGIPDPLVGLAEDCCALAIGHTLIATAQRNRDTR